MQSGIHVAAQCDFTNPGDVQELGLLLRRVWGCVDVVVANVGSGLSVADLIPAPEQFDRIMALNFGSAQLTAYTFFPLLQEVKGNLLFISSIAGIEAIGAPIGYATAKSAVLAFAKNLARKAAPFGIRVNCVAPGNVLFPGGSWEEKMIAQPERISHLIETTVPMQRFGKPEEIATCCVFLCSVAASFVTGAVLVADGGQTLHLN